MIISLIGHEKNLGILTLTDHLLTKLGKENCVVVGWNYLVIDFEPILTKIKEAQQNNKNVLVKYIIPRNKFSTNREICYPDVLNTLSDVVFKVPTYREELAAIVPKVFFKGKNNPIKKYIDEFYSV